MLARRASKVPCWRGGLTPDRSNRPPDLHGQVEVRGAPLAQMSNQGGRQPVARQFQFGLVPVDDFL
jgi:hypothetical protein